MKVTFQRNLTLFAAGAKEASLFSLATPKKRESLSMFGAYAPRRDAFYWKSANKGNAKEFKGFLHQLRARAEGKTLAIILDNASIHRAKYISKFTEKYPRVKLIFLPPYSPEYNPVEQIWKWSKAQVCATQPVGKGLGELLERFRRLHHARTHKRLANPYKVGIGI